MRPFSAIKTGYVAYFVKLDLCVKKCISIKRYHIVPPKDLGLVTCRLMLQHIKLCNITNCKTGN